MKSQLGPATRRDDFYPNGLDAICGSARIRSKLVTGKHMVKIWEKWLVKLSVVNI
jgi:hypothetical protein